MKNFWIILLILIGVTLLLVVTCPDNTEHKEAITQSLSSAIMGEMIEEDNNVLGLAITSTFGKPLIGAIIDGMLVVDNYFVVSIGRLQRGDENKTVSIGMLGHVFTFSKEDIQENMKNNQPIDDCTN